jgi:hypothetical protein
MTLKGTLSNAALALRYRLYDAAWREVADYLCIRLAWVLPRRLVRWCFYRVLAHATTGEWGATVVPDLAAMDAAARWEVQPGRMASGEEVSQ